MNTPSFFPRHLGRACLAAALACPLAAEAGITRIVVESTQPAGTPPATPAPGIPFEVITGKAYGEIDPKDRRNAIITDIQFAPRNPRGMVEYVTTFTLTKPVDLTKASGLLMYGVSNRGGGVSPSADNNARGDMFLVSGWQGDVGADSQRVEVPIARNPDGSSITGTVMARFPLTQAAANLTLPGQRTPVSHDTAKAMLSKRVSEDSVVVPIASDQWSFVDDRTITIKGGFEAGFLYELVYVAKDPSILGIGLAATRDVVSFFRRSARDGAGVANPIAGRVRHVISIGASQSGNFIKTFIHLGFNEDESGRIVWDGANPHIAGRQNPLNYRFAVPGGATAPYEPGSEPVLWWSAHPDVLRGRPTAGMLDRAKKSGTVPKIFETFGSAEFWGLRMSPNLVGTSADKDIPLPDTVRRYYFPGTVHGGGRGGFSAIPRAAGNKYGIAANVNPANDTLRALRIALIEWVTLGREPPPSRYPRLDRGELVVPEAVAMGFPRIPGAALPDNMINTLHDYHFGPDFNHNDLSGVMRHPPVRRRVIPQLVPRVDADGNEVGGVPSVLHQAPLGSYLGWTVTLNGFYRDRQSGYNGGFIPFPMTKEERIATGDPRLSIEERYGTHEKYVAIVRTAAARAVAERVLLQADADRIVREAEASNVLNPGPTGSAASTGASYN